MCTGFDFLNVKTGPVLKLQLKDIFEGCRTKFLKVRADACRI